MHNFPNIPSQRAADLDWRVFPSMLLLDVHMTSQKYEKMGFFLSKTPKIFL